MNLDCLSKTPLLRFCIGRLNVNTNQVGVSVDINGKIVGCDNAYLISARAQELARAVIAVDINHRFKPCPRQ